jgi:hypothetical protein
MIIEMRTYLLKAGTVASFEQRFADAVKRRRPSVKSMVRRGSTTR